MPTPPIEQNLTAAAPRAEITQERPNNQIVVVYRGRNYKKIGQQLFFGGFFVCLIPTIAALTVIPNPHIWTQSDKLAFCLTTIGGSFSMAFGALLIAKNNHPSDPHPSTAPSLRYR